MLFSRPHPTSAARPRPKATRKLARLVFVAVVVVALAPLHSDATQPRYSPLDGSVLELTKLIPPSESITAYTAPSDAAMVLTRFCGDQCVSCQGTSLREDAFHTGRARCVRYQPGIELPPGETVRCTNHCSKT